MMYLYAIAPVETPGTQDHSSVTALLRQHHERTAGLLTHESVPLTLAFGRGLDVTMLPALADALAHPDPVIREQAVSAIKTIGLEAFVPEDHLLSMAQLASDPNPEVAEWALEELCVLALCSNNAHNCASAAREVAKLGPRGTRKMDEVRGLF
jgi:hypothetical protein